MNNLFEFIQFAFIFLLSVTGLSRSRQINALKRELKTEKQISEIRGKHHKTLSDFTLKSITLISKYLTKSKEEFSEFQTEIESNFNTFVKDFNDNFTTVGENEAKLKQALKLIASENKQFNLRLNALSSNIHKIDDECKVSFLKVGEKLGVTKKEDEILSKKQDKSKVKNEKFDIVKEHGKLFLTLKDKNLKLLEILNYIEDSSKVSPKVYQTLGGKTPAQKAENLFQMIERSKLLTKQEISDQKHILKFAKKNYPVGTKIIPVEVIPSLKKLISSEKSSAVIIQSPIFEFKGCVLYARVSVYNSVPIYYNGNWAEIIPSTNE